MGTLPLFRRFRDLVLREGPADPVPFAVFEGEVPTRAQQRRILKHGFGLHLIGVPAEHEDLAFLGGYVGLKALGVLGAGYDTRIVGQLTALRDLSLSVVDAPDTDLTGLRSLESFSGVIEPNRSVFELPALKKVFLHDVGVATLPPLPAGVEELELSRARRIRSIAPQAGSTPSLRQLSLDGPRVFDLACLPPFGSLSVLSLSNIGRIEHTSSLSRLPLRELGLIHCRTIDDVPSLADLRNVKATVIGKIAPAVAEVRRDVEPEWAYLSRL